MLPGSERGLTAPRASDGDERSAWESGLATLHDLDLDAFRLQALSREPFEYLVVPQFVKREALARINADYPRIAERGSFPVAQVDYGPAFQTLLDQLESPELREAFEEKFNIDLAGRPTTTTVRGWCGAGDGKVHTDSVSKIITVLIYMNMIWENLGGRLRLLRSGDDLNGILVEVPPIGGTLIAFTRAEIHHRAMRRSPAMRFAPERASRRANALMARRRRAGRSSHPACDLEVFACD